MLTQFDTTGLVRSRLFDIPELDVTNFDVDYHYHPGGPEKLQVGITFSNNAVIDDQTFTSNGGKDVLILSLDAEGNVTNSYQYGSEFAENVSQILSTYYEPDNSTYLFFGGEFSTRIFRRQLGDVEFINTKRGIDNAYVTYIRGDGPAAQDQEATIQPLAEHNTITETPDQIALEAYPNPFQDAFQINYFSEDAAEAEIEIFDLFSRRIYHQQETLDGGSLQSTIDLNVSDGFYLISVKDDLGNIRSMKILRTGESEEPPSGKDD